MGEGTRLRPLTFDRPKPSIPIMNKPSVVHLIEHLAKEGFNEIVITIGYMAEKIEESLGDGRMFGVHIDYVYEETKLGTAGSVKNAEEYLKDEPFIIVGGDHVMDLNLRNMYRYHETNDAIVTIGLMSIDDPRNSVSLTWMLTTGYTDSWKNQDLERYSVILPAQAYTCALLRSSSGYLKANSTILQRTCSLH